MISRFLEGIRIEDIGMKDSLDSKLQIDFICLVEIFDILKVISKMLNPDKGKVVYDGEASIDQLVKFIKSEALPLVNEFNEETAPKIFGGDINQHILLFIAKSDENYDAIQAGFAAAAKVGVGIFRTEKYITVPCM